VVERKGDGYLPLGYGAIVTGARTPWPRRLQEISLAVREIAGRHAPRAAAVEELFFAKDSRTASSVGHGRGVLLYTLAELGLPIHEYNPRQVKVALTGYGSADKSQMQSMVQRLLGLKEIPKPDDAADALAIALCHLNTMTSNFLLPLGEGAPPARMRGKASVGPSGSSL
jgi:crossover junction endodeoxyribonuclease RuvC